MVGSNAVKGPDSKEKFKTIGVLGGLGPQATMDFEAKVHRAAQRLIPSHQNSGYPPMVVYYYRHPPILLNADNSPKIPITPDPRILDVAKRIGIHADFLVVPSNGAHMLQGLIERSAGRMVLSMIEAGLPSKATLSVAALSHAKPRLETLNEPIVPPARHSPPTSLTWLATCVIV